MRIERAAAFCLAAVFVPNLVHAQEGSNAAPEAANPVPASVPGGPTQSRQPEANAPDAQEEKPPRPRLSQATQPASPAGATASAGPSSFRPADEPKDNQKDDLPQTLLSSGRPAVGAYGGVSVLGSRTLGQDVVYVGGEGAVLLDHRLALGLAGYGLASHVAGPNDIYQEPRRLTFGYGGLIIRYSLLTRRPYYLTLGSLVGAGGMAYTPEWDGDWSEHHHVHTSPVFVVEPSLAGHLNLTRFIRLGLQVSYRFVSRSQSSIGDELPRSKELSGFAYGGHVQFGWF